MCAAPTCLWSVGGSGLSPVNTCNINAEVSPLTAAPPYWSNDQDTRSPVYHVAPKPHIIRAWHVFSPSLPASLRRGDFQMFIIKRYVFSKELPFSLLLSVCGNKITLCCWAGAPISMTTQRNGNAMLVLWIKYTNSSL